jgi:hypothetical protein
MAQFSLSTASNLFKIKYGKLSENTYNSANVLLGRVKKDFNFTGKRMDLRSLPLLLAVWVRDLFRLQTTLQFKMR